MSKKTCVCWFGGLFLILMVSGCVTGSHANAQAQAAFAAGQQQAIAQQTAGPTVHFRGDVKKTTLPWTEELSLAQALVAAEYSGLWDPHIILIIRKGETFRIDPKRVLRGLEDPMLEPNDTVEVHR